MSRGFQGVLDQHRIPILCTHVSLLLRRPLGFAIPAMGLVYAANKLDDQTTASRSGAASIRVGTLRTGTEQGVSERFLCLIRRFEQLQAFRSFSGVLVGSFTARVRAGTLRNKAV